VAGGAFYLGTRKSATLQDTVSKQNPVILPSISPQSNNKPTPDTKPQNDETANWRVYTSNDTLKKLDMNFSIKYPQDWYKNENNPHNTSFVPWVVFSRNLIPDVYYRNSPCLSIGGGSWPSAVDLKGVASQLDSTTISSSPNSITNMVPFIKSHGVGDIIVNSLTGIKRKVTRYDENQETTQIILRGSPTIYPGDIVYYIIESCPGTDENIFNQILSTFKS